MLLLAQLLVLSVMGHSSCLDYSNHKAGDQTFMVYEEKPGVQSHVYCMRLDGPSAAVNYQTATEYNKGEFGHASVIPFGSEDTYPHEDQSSFGQTNVLLRSVNGVAVDYDNPAPELQVSASEPDCIADDGMPWYDEKVVIDYTVTDDLRMKAYMFKNDEAQERENLSHTMTIGSMSGCKLEVVVEFVPRKASGGLDFEFEVRMHTVGDIEEDIRDDIRMDTSAPDKVSFTVAQSILDRISGADTTNADTTEESEDPSSSWESYSSEDDEESSSSWEFYSSADYEDFCLEACWFCQDGGNVDNCLEIFDPNQSGPADEFDCDIACTGSPDTGNEEDICLESCWDCQNGGNVDNCLESFDPNQSVPDSDFDCDIACTGSPDTGNDEDACLDGCFACQDGGNVDNCLESFDPNQSPDSDFDCDIACTGSPDTGNDGVVRRLLQLDGQDGSAAERTSILDVAKKFTCQGADSTTTTTDATFQFVDGVVKVSLTPEQAPVTCLKLFWDPLVHPADAEPSPGSTSESESTNKSPDSIDDADSGAFSLGEIYSWFLLLFTALCLI